MTKTKWIRAALLLFPAVACANAISDAYELDKLDYSCEWVANNPPPKSIEIPAYCRTKVTDDIDATRAIFRDFWYAWAQLPRTIMLSPKSRFEDWLGTRADHGPRVVALNLAAEIATRERDAAADLQSAQDQREMAEEAAKRLAAANVEAAQLAAKAKADRAKAKAQMIAASSTTDIVKLCNQYRANKYPELINAIRDRAVFTTREVQHIERKTIFVGMTEGAARCSWGPADKVNRTTTRSGVDLQIIFGDTYVYTENGIVTAIQD